MYKYKAKIRIGGSVLNEVVKSNLSAPEVIILRHLHGSDAVLELEEIGQSRADRTSHHELRKELAEKYVYRGNNDARTKFSLEKLFGPENVPLPARLEEFAQAEKEEAGVITRRQGRQPKRGAKNEVLETDVADDEVDPGELAE